MNKLKKDAFLGMLWSGGNSVFTQVILLVVKLILVRLLIPEQFGLAAMAFIVVSSLNILNAFGTGTAFVRDNKSDLKKAKNTLFYLDSVAHVLIAIIGLFSAPYVANFFAYKLSDPQSVVTLVWMLRIIALSQLTNLIVIVPGATLTKEIKFKEKTIATFLGTVTYGLVAPVLAFMGFGPWAIVLGSIADVTMSKVIMFGYAPFIPSLSFDWQIAKDYLNFGKNAFFSSVIGVVITNGDDTLIGRLLGAAALGFYSLGQHFASVIVSLVTGMISKVLFPVFSKLQDDKEAYRRAFFKGFRLKTMLAVPAIGGAVVLAREIVVLIFSEKWLPILPIFYVLSLGSFISTIVGLASPVLNSLGKPEVLRNNRLIQFGFYVVLIYPFIKLWGILGVAWVMVIFSFVSLVYYTPILAKEIKGFYRYIGHVWVRVIPATLLMMCIVYYVKSLVEMNLIWLFVLVFLGVLVYFSLMWFLDKDLRWDFREALGVFFER